MSTVISIRFHNKNRNSFWGVMVGPIFSSRFSYFSLNLSFTGCQVKAPR
ncbi:hypothetical protein Hdeb2414_s0028g00697931 [Helianthus debilis subsp. tardiflorus]